MFSVFLFFFVWYLNKRSFVIACDGFCVEFYAEIFLFFQFNAVILLKLVYFSELFFQLFANFLFFMFSHFPVFYYNFAFVFKWAVGTCIIKAIFSSKIAQMCIQYQTKKNHTLHTKNMVALKTSHGYSYTLKGAALMLRHFSIEGRIDARQLGLNCKMQMQAIKI